MHYSQGRFDEALKWLKKAVDLEPGVARFYALLALQYFELGDDESAGPWLRRALEFQPDASFPRLIQAYTDLSSGRIYEARKRVGEILRDHPDESNVLDAAGDVELIAGSWEAAQGHYRKLVDLVSWRGQPGAKLAFTLMKLGRTGEGEALLRQNLEFCLGLEGIDRPGSPVRYYLAEIYALLGRKTEALEAFEKAEACGYYDRWIISDPLVDGIRGEPRFRAIREKFGSRVAGMRRRAAELR
jgi:tetratricopeptide (TPR) repeat protein